MIGPLTPRLIAELESRRIDPELAVRMGWGAMRGSGGGEAIAIPFLREGTPVNHKYRTSIRIGEKGKIWQDAGGVKCFWNEDALRDDSLLGDPLIITEGEPDGMAAIQSGFLRTVSVPEGAPSKPIEDENSTKYAFIEDVRRLLTVERCPQIILAVDGDEAGGNLLHDLSLRLGRFRCKFVTYPKHPEERDRRLKDLNDVLLHYGEAGVKATLERAQWLKVDGVYRMSELPPAPVAPIYDIGFPVLRDHYKLRLGDIAIWTGIPSHGKSSMVNDLCCRVAQLHGLTVGFASFEQMPQRDHRRNLRTWFCQKPVAYCDPFDLRKADEWIDKHFSFIVPSEDEEVTLEWLLDKMEVAVIQHGVKVMVIDPWNEMDHSKDRAESLTEYTGRAIKALRRFAKTMMVHLIIVAHPSKQQKDENGAYRVPTLYDISDSAHWYNKADLGVVVHRHRSPDYTLVRVAKSRYHDEIGTPGDVEMAFAFEKRRFDPITLPGDDD